MKSKLNSDKNIGTVGQVLVRDDDDNLCWRDETEEIIKSLEDCVVKGMVYEPLSLEGRKNFENYDFTVGKLMNMLKKFPEDMKICLGGDESIYEIPYDKLKIKIVPTKNKNLLQIGIEGFWTNDNDIT